ncbi:MAG TPA: response regulator [Verrucomicrobiae bacterium]|nr:response regulator [Verrucomicrobiae bacterium]
MNHSGIKTILIIDDDAPLASGMQKLLVRNAYIVHVARNGKAGLAVLEQEPVDLVITDIFMEEMEGLETILAVRRKFPGTRVVAMSGGSSVVGLDCLDLAKTLGAELVLRKPFLFDALADTIQKLELAGGNGARFRSSSRPV